MGNLDVRIIKLQMYISLAINGDDVETRMGQIDYYHFLISARSRMLMATWVVYTYLTSLPDDETYVRARPGA